jgi:hypothetical protein
MVQPKRPTGRVALKNAAPMQMQQVSGKAVSGNGSFSTATSSAVYRQRTKRNRTDERGQIATAAQVEAYRLVKLTGEARYAVTLFASTAARAEIGVSQPQAMSRKAVWVNEGPEVDAFAIIAPDVRSRSKLIRDYMTHRTIAGECYLIARSPQSSDPQYIQPPMNPLTPGQRWESWDEYLHYVNGGIDALDPRFDPSRLQRNPNTENPIWEIVGVTEIQKIGQSDLSTWRVRLDNDNWVDLDTDDPVIRMWTPDPERRREAWSPIMSMLSTLQEIEWETKNIFAQIKSRLINAGVWFLPNNLTFPEPPPDSIEGGEEAIAALNEAELFMIALAQSSMQELEADEVGFPTVVTADPLALAEIDKSKLIQFWSEVDDKVIQARADAIRRFALGMDLMPEDTLGSSGLAVTGAGGSAGSVNHWGVWANEEKTISLHAEPALDELVGTLTSSVLRLIVPTTKLVIGYSAASMRMKQDRSKESMELYDRGELKGEVMVRENGFDPENDMMNPQEKKIWILQRLVSGSPSPEQMQAAFMLLTDTELPVAEPVSGNEAEQRGAQAPQQPRSLDDHPNRGAPQEQHDHSDAPYGVVVASSEGLVLRALEKAGNIVLNDGRRGRDRDFRVAPVQAHLEMEPAKVYTPADFDFSLADMVFVELPPLRRRALTTILSNYCARLYNSQREYSRDGLIAALTGEE